MQETTAAIALRLFELNLIPVKRIEENWMMQLKNLFALTDFEIPGYEVSIHQLLQANSILLEEK